MSQGRGDGSIRRAGKRERAGPGLEETSGQKVHTHQSAATRAADLRGQKKKTNTDKNHNNLLLIYPLENLFP